MRENVTQNADLRWTPEGLAKLQQLWAKDVPVDVIAVTLGRPPAAVREKAVEMRLPRQ